LVKALNLSDFKVLITNLKEKDVYDFGLHDLYLVETLPIENRGGASHSLSMYFKKRCTKKELINLSTNAKS